jgi:hypothetical protein
VCLQYVFLGFAFPLGSKRYWLAVSSCSSSLFIVGFFDFVSFYLQYTYQYSFISVVKDWSVVDQGYFAYTQTLTLTFGAICAGFFQLYFRRTKWLLTGGLLVRLLGIGLMIKSRGAHGSTGCLVITQSSRVSEEKATGEKTMTATETRRHPRSSRAC